MAFSTENSWTINDIFSQKRRSLYDSLTEAKLAGNQALVHGLLVAICRYSDDPRVLEEELRGRGFLDPL